MKKNPTSNQNENQKETEIDLDLFDFESYNQSVDSVIYSICLNRKEDKNGKRN